MKNLKVYLIAGLVILAVGFSIGRYVVPDKSLETKSTEHDVKREETVTTREEIRADGTRITETIKSNKNEESKKKESSKLVENSRPNWKVNALAGYNIDKSNYVYGVAVDRRVLGNISVGAWGTTDKQVGLSLGLEF